LYLLYLDESGHSHDPNTQFFVLAGFCIFERQTHWLDSAITPIAARFNPADLSAIEFHGAPMHGGKFEWSKVSPIDRVQAVVDILSLLSNQQLKLRVFASVIEKYLVPVDQILQQSFENVAVQFDQFLGDMYLRKNPQRGLGIFDKTNYEEKLQALSHVLEHEGHANGKLRNFAEVPLFLDSKSSRLIQMADVITYWIFRHYESGDDRGFKLIAPYFYHKHKAPQGQVTLVTPAATARLPTLPPAAYPFPGPTPPTRRGSIDRADHHCRNQRYAHDHWPGPVTRRANCCAINSPCRRGQVISSSDSLSRFLVVTTLDRMRDLALL
jgi:hypothetical protein